MPVYQAQMSETQHIEEWIPPFIRKMLVDKVGMSQEEADKFPEEGVHYLSWVFNYYTVLGADFETGFDMAIKAFREATNQ